MAFNLLESDFHKNLIEFHQISPKNLQNLTDFCLQLMVCMNPSYRYIHLSIYPSIHPSIHPSIYLKVVKYLQRFIK